MALPHNVYQLNVSIKEVLTSILNDRTIEKTLAESESFFFFDDDISEVADSYFGYFQDTADAITEILGEPLYCGTWDAEGVIEKWILSLQLSAGVASLAVWNTEGIRVYLRCNWEDKELPLSVTLGTEGCRPK
jgi:hypothetical protein